ncbi:MAG: hypothetical protein KAQ63_02055 [Candidatus Moranbacteria bacterium]|nr:hypothetical protein [Candidatus Moranbacteria bacterium]
MRLTKKQVKDFQQIYKKLSGKEISYQEAMESGTKLARLIEVVYKPITKKEHDNFLEFKKRNNA